MTASLLAPLQATASLLPPVRMLFGPAGALPETGGVTFTWDSVDDAVEVERGTCSLAGVVHAGRCQVDGEAPDVNRVVERLQAAFSSWDPRFTPFVSRTTGLDDDAVTGLRDAIGPETVLLGQVTAQAQAYQIGAVAKETGEGFGRWALADASYDIHVTVPACHVTPSGDGTPLVALTIEDPLSWMRWLGCELEFADLFIQDALTIDGEFSVLEGIGRALPHLR